MGDGFTHLTYPPTHKKVGGVAEMFLVGGEKERLYLKKHKGFVREAIKNGADLVPVFCFGNSKLFSVVGESSRVSMGTYPTPAEAYSFYLPTACV